MKHYNVCLTEVDVRFRCYSCSPLQVSDSHQRMGVVTSKVCVRIYGLAMHDSA